MSMYVNIEDKDGLVRDMSSGAVLNTNHTEYENYLRRRDAAKQERLERESQAADINYLKSELSEMKQMLLQISNQLSKKE